MLEPCNVCGRCMDREASNVHLTKMRSVSLIRCLPKMSPSSSTSTGSQIATWKRSLTWTRHDFDFDLRPPSTGKMFVWSPAFLPEPGSTRYSSAPSIQLSDLTIRQWFRLHITTSLKSISQKRWLYHLIFKMVVLTNSTLSINLSTMSCDQSFFVLIGQNRLQLMSVMIIHKYVNIQTSVVRPQYNQ